MKRIPKKVRDLEGKNPRVRSSNCYCYNFNVSYSMGMTVFFGRHLAFAIDGCIFFLSVIARAHVTEKSYLYAALKLLEVNYFVCVKMVMSYPRVEI